VARKRKITGQATVQFIVHENGQVRDAHLIKSLADAFTTSEDRTDAQTLYQKAIEAVYHYHGCVADTVMYLTAQLGESRCPH
jgi:hypothetical protein